MLRITNYFEINVYFLAPPTVTKAEAHVSEYWFQTRPAGQLTTNTSPHRSHWINLVGSGCGKNNLLAAIVSAVHGFERFPVPLPLPDDPVK